MESPGDDRNLLMQAAIVENLLRLVAYESEEETLARGRCGITAARCQPQSGQGQKDERPTNMPPAHDLQDANDSIRFIHYQSNRETPILDLQRRSAAVFPQARTIKSCARSGEYGRVGAVRNGDGENGNGRQNCDLRAAVSFIIIDPPRTQARAAP